MKDAVRDPAELCRLLDLPDEFADTAQGGRATVSAVRAARLRRPHATRRPDRSAAATGAAARRRNGRRAGLRRRPGRRSTRPRATPACCRSMTAACCSIATGTCAVHCRYCFRRHFPYDESPRSLDDWQPAFDEIAARHVAPRSDSQRRRSADARRCHARRDDRAAGDDSALAAAANSHAAADRDSRARDGRTRRPCSATHA